MSPGTELERVPTNSPGARISVEAMAAAVHREFAEASAALFPVEAAEAGGITPVNQDDEGVHWLDIWHQFPKEVDGASGE